tara:strand:- start:966 stop:1469 length:504 start_codon:yes stop_codon:yes gene_type:complete
MSLGTTLEADILSAITNSEDADDFASGMASAINAYLSGAVYGAGTLTFTSSVSAAGFKLETSGTASGAATQIANHIQSYWGGVVAGVPAAPTALDVVVSGNIQAATVAATLKPKITAIFNDKEGSPSKVAESLADEISAVTKAIVVDWVEFAAGPPPVTLPLVGSIT